MEEREAVVERQAAHLQGLQERLLQQDPDLHKLSEMLSQRQREEREERDGKVLRVLRNKDQTIATLNGQVEGLERALETTRSKLAAADRALQDKLKDAEREWRQHTEALTSSNVPCLPPLSHLFPPSLPPPVSLLTRCCTIVTPCMCVPLHVVRGAPVNGVRVVFGVQTCVQMKWREAQEEALGLRAKLHDIQAKAVESGALQRQLAEAERGRARMEAEVEQLLAQRSQMEEQCAWLQAGADGSKAKDETIVELRRQLHDQSVIFALAICR